MDAQRAEQLLNLANVQDKGMRRRVVSEVTTLEGDELTTMLLIRQHQVEHKVDRLAGEVQGRGSWFRGGVHVVQMLYTTTLFVLFGKGTP